MKKLKRIVLPIALSVSVGCMTTACLLNPTEAEAKTEHVEDKDDLTKVQEKKKIKVALLLDTSNSMDGLINQAKSQLWKLVNELTKAECDGEKPEIQIALYQYGNQGLSASSGYIEQVLDFTGELDEVSAKLFALTTNGGEEYCGQVIQKSINELSWGTNEGDLKFIFIAGNEAFTQGPVSFATSCQNAKEKDIVVNTIFCGNYTEGVNTSWRAGATLTEGSYMSINHDNQTAYVSTPFDDKIDSLNTQINGTYLYYGRSGSSKMMNMTTQDANASSISKENKIERTVTKSKKTYQSNTRTWDLVESTKDKSDDEIVEQLNEIEEETLSEDLKNKSSEEQVALIKEKTQEREKIKKEIAELAIKRETYIANQNTTETEDLNSAIIKAVKTKAKAKNYNFK